MVSYYVRTGFYLWADLLATPEIELACARAKNTWLTVGSE